MKLDPITTAHDDAAMKTLNTWREVADALGVCIPTARQIVARDRRIRAVVKVNGVHPLVSLKALRDAVDGRQLKMPRGKKS